MFEGARSKKLFHMACATAAMVLATFAWGQKVKGGKSTLDDLVKARAELVVPTQIRDLGHARTEGVSPTTQAFDAFVAKNGKWALFLDGITGRPALMEGSGIPFIPGTANALKGSAFGLSPVAEGGDVPVDLVAAKALDLLRSYPDLFGVDPNDLALKREASGPVGEYLYFLDFQWQYHGIPVDKAHLVFRLNHGNLVQMGAEYISPVISKLDVTPSITTQTAWQALAGYVGSLGKEDKVLDPGRLRIVPMATPEAASGAAIPLGSGLEYHLVYSLVFHRKGIVGTWEGLVDAHTGELLSFKDTNDYGSVHGGVYMTDSPATEVDRPLPFADVASGVYANAGGVFTGDSATSALNGQYVTIDDTCGAISLSTSNGNLNFGMSTGTDCTTPGFGGAGDTHAARTQYYQVNLIKQKAMGYLPSNTWLPAKLMDTVNLNQVCNAYWSTTVQNLNFFASGGGCANTGELPGVSLHEFGHGLDQNDGNGPSPDNGTGETYGDFTAALQTHQSCGGSGFFLNGVNCGGYGNPCTNCSGIRDLDYARHASPTPATASQLNGSTGFNCPVDAGYPGPCGYEGHCESYISSEALWDLATRDLVTWGLDVTTAWQLVDRLWYLSRPTATGAYACNTSTLATDGCGIGSLFTVFRVADDADGNLANGTPHASAIYAAFNRHAIACTSVNNTDQAGACPGLGQATLTASPGNNSVDVQWSSVSGASKYIIYRNEMGCGAGYTKIGESTALSFNDGTVVNDVTYYYRVQAVGTTNACTGPMSACATITPVPCLGTFTLNRGVFSCADAIAITLADSDLSGTGTLNVSVFSDVETTPETVTLTETPAGSARFTGTIATGASTAHGDGTIGVVNGGSVTLRYQDADACGTGPQTVDRTVPVDCQPPVISNIQVASTDIEATVTWTTDEPANSLLTWGNSVPPGMVISDLANYGTSHSVTIKGLSGCTTYFFNATSSDPAGNTATDDGAGTYHPFVTKGLSYLLKDDVESGGSNWTVQTTSGSAWHIDTCRAHSTSHAWKAGSSAQCPGTYAANTQTYLASQSLNLGASGHGYHLRWWDWGITEVNGYGLVMDWCHVQISTNGGTSYSDLIPPFGGNSNGWQFNDIDLAAYSGTVKIRFYFQSDSDWEYEGWYVDDVEVSRTTSCLPDLRYQAKSLTDFCSGGGAGSSNGTVDPGEDVALAVTLYNQGPAKATGAVGTLTTTTSGITITGAASSFSDIPSMGTGGSRAPYFSFNVGTSVPCGTVINFNIHVVSNESAAGWDVPFTLTTGSQGAGAPVTDLTENFNSSGTSGWPTNWARTPTSGTGQYWRVPSYQVYTCTTSSDLNMQVDSSSSNNANAWGFTKSLSLTSGTTYALTFNQRTGGCGTISDAGGTLEVWIGTAQTIAGMTSSLQTWSGLTNTTCMARSLTFTVPSTGTYYVGFHYVRTASLSYCGLDVDDVLIQHTPLICTQAACTPSAGLKALTSATPVYTPKPGTITFTGLAHGGTAPYTYAWAFGDGGTSTLQSPTYTYTTSGTFTAALTVTDATSATNTDSHLSIKIVDVLTVAAGADKTSGAPPLSVNFTATPSGGSGVYTYDWNYGDGTAHGTTQGPSHTYSGCGYFTVTLKVTDDHAATATDDHLVIAVAGPPGATASLGGCATGAAPFSASFTGTASCGTPPYTYSWDFGDGSALSAAQSPYHTYTNSGSYSAVLTVKDATNATTSSTPVAVTVAAGGGTITENFDGVTPPAIPATWTGTIVSGSYNWKTNAGTVSPSGSTAHSAPNLVYYDCYNASSGSQARLKYNTLVPLGNATGRIVQVALYMFHDMGFTSYQDNIQIQYSTDGTTWNNVGSPIYRYDGSAGWKQHTVDLSGVCVANAYIAILATSKYGYDIHLDDINIVNVATPATDVYDSSAIASDTCSSDGAGNHDGVIDPGETINVNVTVKNTGGTASSDISGTLSTSTSGVTVTSATASFPDMAGYMHASTSATPFTYTVDETVPCGTVISFTLALSTSQGPFSIPFTMVVGGSAGNPVCHACQPACSIASCAAGADAMGGNAPLEVSFTGSLVDTCTGSETYSWIFGDTGTSTLQSPSHLYISPGTYAVTMSVSDGHGNECSDNHLSITVTLAKPSEIAPGTSAATAQSWGDKNTHTWPASAQAVSYNLYRGTLADLPKLITGTANACTRYSGAANSVAVGDDPSSVSGGCYWYLVTGVNGSGEGTAGSATSGARAVNSTGPCP